MQEAVSFHNSTTYNEASSAVSVQLCLSHLGLELLHQILHLYEDRDFLSVSRLLAVEYMCLIEGHVFAIAKHYMNCMLLKSL